MALDTRSQALETIALPESPSRVAGLFRSEGWNSIVYFDASGRAWRLDFEADGSARVAATALRVEDPNQVDGMFCDLAAHRIVFGYGDTLVDTVRVHDLTTGKLLLELPDQGFFATCLTPDGRYLMQFEEKRTLLWSLDGQSQTPLASGIFHRFERRLPGPGYSPESATRVTSDDGSGVFHVLVGHNSFAVDYALAITCSGPPDPRLRAPARVHSDFIFDPVYSFAGGRYPRIAISDGYGSQLKLLDVKTGVIAVCPRSTDETSSGYTHYHDVAPGNDRWYVKTADGWFIWDFLTNTSRRFCDLTFDVVHVGNDFVWVIEWTNAAALVRCAIER